MPKSIAAGRFRCASRAICLILGVLIVMRLWMVRWRLTETLRVYSGNRVGNGSGIAVDLADGKKLQGGRTETTLHGNVNKSTTTYSREERTIIPATPLPIKSSFHITRDSNDTLAHLDFHIPAILATHAIYDDDVSSNNITQLVQFVQGAESYRHRFYLNVTSCIIGNRTAPVSKRLINLFVCRFSFKPKLGDRISLVLGKPVFKRINRRLKRRYEVWIKEGTRMQGGLRVVRSEQVWGRNVGLDARVEDVGGKIWEVCSMYQDKKSNVSDIKDWIEYHRRIGVDRVHIYDNNVKADVLAREFRGRDDVEIIFWPWRKSQEIAQNHFLVLSKTRCKWVLMCDVDEYLAIRPPGESVTQVLNFVEKKGSFGAISLPSLTMGSSGHTNRPEGSVPEVYMHRVRRGDWHQRKPLVLANDVIPRSIVHFLPLRDGRSTFRMKSHPERWQRIRNYVFLVHYQKKSWEDFFKKSQIGRSALEVNDWSWGSKERSSGHERYKNKRKSHVGMNNQVLYREFHSIWKRTMKRKLGAPKLVSMRRDPCVTCWYRSRVRYQRHS